MAVGGKRIKQKNSKKREGNTISKNPLINIYSKLDRLEKKVDLLKKQQELTEDDIEADIKVSKETERDVEKIEKDVDSIEKDIEKIEEQVIKIGRISVGREHMMELARGTAGAFLGVGIGLGIRWMPGVAENISWLNAFAILGFIFIIGAILIYKNEKDWIEKHGNNFIFKRLIHLFAISLAVEIIALYLFNMMPTDPEIITKTLIVGAYPAMSGAITFTIS